MAFDISTIFDSRNSINYLVDQYIKLESRPRDRLIARKNSLNNRRQSLTDLDSKLSTLNTHAERMTDEITDYFALKKATSSDEELVLSSASSTASTGTHSLTVERLASADTRVSSQFTDTDSSFTGITSDQTFTVTVGSYYTDGNSDSATYGDSIYQRVDIDVTVEASVFTQTDNDVLADIADAITDAMGEALTTTVDYDGDGDDDEYILNNIDIVNADVVEEEDGVSRLILRSASSGFSYRMDFTDSSDGLLTTLDINSGSESSGTAGGYITSVGSSVNDSELNSKFELNGLTFYRDLNNVTDALTGVNLTILNSFSNTETVTVGADVEGVQQEVQNFLDAFNESINYLKNNAQMDPTTKQRGILADDTLYRQLSSDLRYKLATIVSDVSSATYDRLYDLGIEPDSYGNYSIVDASDFTLALEANSENVAEIFNAETDGIATLVNGLIETFVSVGGTIDSSQETIDDSVIQLNERIRHWDEILENRRIQLKDEFSRVQTLMSQLSQQQSFLNNFSTYR